MSLGAPEHPGGGAGAQAASPFRPCKDTQPCTEPGTEAARTGGSGQAEVLAKVGAKGKQREAAGARGWALGAEPAPPWVQEGLAAEMRWHVPSWRNTRQRPQKPGR